MNATKLSFGDFAGIATLLLAAIGTIYLIDIANTSASEARMMASIEGASQGISLEVSKLKDDFDSTSGSIENIVRDGLQKRSDEILLALTKVKIGPDQLSVRLTNIPTSGEFYEKFKVYATHWGTETSIYTLGDRATASINIKNFNTEQAKALQTLVNQAQNWSDVSDQSESSLAARQAIGPSNIGVQFIFSNDWKNSDKTLAIELLNQQITELRDELERLEAN